MKKTFLTIALAAALFAGCTDLTGVYDSIDGNTARIEELEGRVGILEEQVRTLNSDAAAIQAIINAVQKNIFVTKVESITDGYTITFSDGTTTTIKNGGKGDTGATPVVSAKQDTDGVWYWTVDGQWLLVDGAKVVASGKDGQNGRTPEFDIDESGNLLVRFSSNEEWTILGNIKGPEGDAGDSFFSSISIGDGVVTFVLADDTTFSVPLSAGDEEITSVQFIPEYSDGAATMTKNGSDPAVISMDFAIRGDGGFYFLNSLGSQRSGNIWRVKSAYPGHAQEWEICIVAAPVQTRRVNSNDLLHFVVKNTALKPLYGYYFNITASSEDMLDVSAQTAKLEDGDYDISVIISNDHSGYSCQSEFFPIHKDWI